LCNRIADIDNRTAQRLRDQFVDITTLEKTADRTRLGLRRPQAFYRTHSREQNRTHSRKRLRRSHISALERAEKGPSLGTILKLAHALDISAGEMVSMVEAKLEKKR
jgi:transcriptional regulator with XRE-family HTH domain